MKKLILIIGISLVWASGFSQSLSLKYMGFYFKRADLPIEWDVKPNTVAKKVWIYDVTRNSFSKAKLLNLANFCGLSETNKTYDGPNGMDFDSPDKTEHLGTFYPWGGIEFTTKEIQHSETNLVKGLPDGKVLMKRTLKLLHEIGIKPSDIKKNETNSKPNIVVGGSTAYYDTITNVVSRDLSFWRAIDGMKVIGLDTGGNGLITYQDYGKVTALRIAWPNVKRVGRMDTPTPETIMKLIREGKCTQRGIEKNLPDIDWPTVQKIKVQKEYLSYYAGMPEDRMKQLKPIVNLWVTIVRGNGSTVDTEIDCPFFDGE